jgi:hypothetical protein
LPDRLVHTCKSQLHETWRQENLKFKASLGYIVSSRTALRKIIKTLSQKKGERGWEGGCSGRALV